MGVIDDLVIAIEGKVEIREKENLGEEQASFLIFILKAASHACMRRSLLLNDTDNKYFVSARIFGTRNFVNKKTYMSLRRHGISFSSSNWKWKRVKPQTTNRTSRLICCPSSIKSQRNTLHD